MHLYARNVDADADGCFMVEMIFYVQGMKVELKFLLELKLD